LTGGTVITVNGWNLSRVKSAAIMKFYNPVFNGTAYYGAVPNRVVVPARVIKIVSDRRILIAAPALNATSPPDSGSTFVVVNNLTTQSLTGLSVQRYNEP
jgi:hypothetical protein